MNRDSVSSHGPAAASPSPCPASAACRPRRRGQVVLAQTGQALAVRDEHGAGGGVRDEAARVGGREGRQLRVDPAQLLARGLVQVRPRQGEAQSQRLQQAGVLAGEAALVDRRDARGQPRVQQDRVLVGRELGGELLGQGLPRVRAVRADEREEHRGGAAQQLAGQLERTDGVLEGRRRGRPEDLVDLGALGRHARAHGLGQLRVGDGGEVGQPVGQVGGGRQRVVGGQDGGRGGVGHGRECSQP
ncbi:hypothetical protein [Micrococcus luteus]|uniref:hypothetical protein n=1 Tax=Micrococcus luteus TaxID=1270 RepID=UPI0031FDC5A4